MVYFSPWKIAVVISVILLGIFFALPNMVPRTSGLADLLPDSRITLGLDLQGGAHLAFQVEADAVVVERLDSLEDEIRTALRGERIGYTGLGVRDNEVTVRVRDLADLGQATKLIRDLGNPVGGLGSLGGGTDIQVESGEGGQVSVRLTEPAIRALKESALRQSIEIIRIRIDEFGTLDPTIQREGQDRIIVQVPGESNPGRIIDLIGRTAEMNFHMHDTSVPVQEALEGRVPPGSQLFPTDDPLEPQILLKRRALVSGEHLVDASPSFDSRRAEPVVSFRFDSSGARRFAEATQKNVGRRFAIVLDGKVISAPVIQEAILSGSGQISGSFTVESANDLAILLRAGALPAPLTAVEQRTVGPDLGADSVAAGEAAAVIGFVGVIIFMLLAYGLFGLFANIALIINLVLIAAVLSVIGSTLTLPGIAGIVLTIGMAVDANVLIFERIREEMRAGKGPVSAVEAGYQRAQGTILDANITTFIAAFILFQLGSGPVRGFSVTLAIGIITSVFTAFTLTRLMVSTWLRMARPKALPI